MAQTTAIQWCDSTENPTMGCDGCELWSNDVQTCYAGVLHRRFGGTSSGYAPSFEQVTRFQGRMLRAARWSDLSGTKREDKPWLNGLPRLIFVSDMSDALSEAIDFEYLKQEIVDVVQGQLGSRHCWLWLTKRPQRMAKFSEYLRGDWPRNLWVATSITSQKTTSRIKHLLKVGNEDTIRFLSVEPQWEEVDLSKWLPHLNWVIQGGESGPDSHPFSIEWAESMISKCREFSVPYFLKQLGSKVTLNGKPKEFEHSHAGDWSKWPKQIRVREMPSHLS